MARRCTLVVERRASFGFVSFSTTAEASTAISEMHLKLVNDTPLYVVVADKRSMMRRRIEVPQQDSARILTKSAHHFLKRWLPLSRL